MKYFMNKAVTKTIATMVLLTGLALSSVSVAGEAEEIAVIAKVLSELMPQGKADSIKPTPFPGMYEAVFGPQIIYVSGDGRYMFEGDLYDLKNRMNLTETKRRVARAKTVRTMDEKTMVVFSPAADKVKHTITAFTDIDCGYCRKMHKQMKQYNELGIAMRYLAYPRSGVNTPSYYKAVSVWCADDKQGAMTKAKSGESLPRVKCDNPIKTHMDAAKLVGVTGTPTMVLENGRVIPGYVEPKRLIKILEQLKNS